VAAARKQPEGNQHAEQAAVKAHSALPHGKYLERMRKIVERLVENDVAESPAEDHAEHAVEQHVVDVAGMPSGQEILPRAEFSEHSKQHEPIKYMSPYQRTGSSNVCEATVNGPIVNATGSNCGGRACAWEVQLR
jgi:hypothetical protein